MMRSKSLYIPQEIDEEDSLIAYNDETLIWQGTPSQWLNLGKFIWWGSVALFAIILLVGFYALGYRQRYPEYKQMMTLVSLLVFTFAVVSISYHFLRLKFQKTMITCNKITESRGFTEIFRKENYCELSDVADVLLPPAGWLALVSRGDLVITTYDVDQPEIRISAIKGRKSLKEKLIPLIRRLRAERRGYRR